jgi:hypothetical protein
MLLAIAPALAQNAPPGNPTNTGFMAQQPGDRLASRLVGLNIQNTADENIGEIYDIILTDAGANEEGQRPNDREKTTGCHGVPFFG